MGRNKFISIAMLLLLGYALCAQEASLEVDVSHDTLYIDHTLRIRYTTINMDSQLDPLDLSDWVLVRGPNTSSRYNMINGVSQSQSSITYYLRPRHIGAYVIPSIQVWSGDKLLASEPVTIIVVHNPKGIQPESRQYGFKQYITILDSMAVSRSDTTIRRKPLKTRRI